MTRILILVLFSFIYFLGNAQISNKEYVDYHIEIKEGMPKAEEGTFQFIITEPKFKPAFTTEILYFVEQRRKEDQDVLIELSHYVSLYIPSRNKISKKDFEFLEPFQF